jgi:hypothetical protein
MPADRGTPPQRIIVEEPNKQWVSRELDLFDAVSRATGLARGATAGGAEMRSKVPMARGAIRPNLERRNWHRARIAGRTSRENRQWPKEGRSETLEIRTVVDPNRVAVC